MLAAGSRLNATALEALEQSAFVVSLDSNTPEPSLASTDKMIDMSRKLWHGDVNDRWWDKPCQWVVFDSGESGIVGEVRHLTSTILLFS